MSSTLAPRERSLIGRAKPCRNGPIAVAVPSHCTSLYPILPESRSGKIKTLARPATAPSALSFFSATTGISAASACSSPSTARPGADCRTSVSARVTLSMRACCALPLVENDNSATRAVSPSRFSALRGLAMASGIAIADQKYPNHAITLVVPFSAGGAVDVVARLLAEYASRIPDQPVVVENVSGAGGTIAAARVARATPDGYTILVGNLGTQVSSVGNYKDLPYDPRRDFA